MTEAVAVEEVGAVLVAASGTTPLWVHPSAVRAGERPPRGRYLSRVGQFLPGRRLSVVQGDGLLGSTLTPAAPIPNRAITLRSEWEDGVDPPARRSS